MSVEKVAGGIRGYVEICVDGLFCERFLNICMHRGIFLWDVKRRGKNRISACVSVENFRELRPVARKTKSKITVVKRMGIPFFLKRYRKRKALVAGLAAGIALLWYLSTHIVGIDITGNSKISEEELLADLKNAGIYYGASVKKIDRNFAKNRMMTECDELAWVGINIKGSRAYVEVKERLDTKIRLDKDVPCDIVAERSGIIQLLEVKNGQTMVRPEQYVEEGDLLVSGVVDSDKKGMRYVHSFGSVFAETVFEKEKEYPFEYTEKIYTGKTKNRFAVSVFGKKFKLFFRDIQPFEYCDKSQNKKEYKAKDTFLPSVFVETDTFTEYVPQKKKRNIDSILSLAKKELSAEIEKDLPKDAEVKDVAVSFSKKGSKSVTVLVKYICNQDIARQRTIDKTDNLEYDVE